MLGLATILFPIQLPKIQKKSFCESRERRVGGLRIFYKLPLFSLLVETIITNLLPKPHSLYLLLDCIINSIQNVQVYRWDNPECKSIS